MGLITKTVEVKFSAYYKKLGYKYQPHIDNQGRFRDCKNSTTTIEVKDLPKGSNIKVLCSCDNCGKEKNIAYLSYMKQIEKHNGKIYCRGCCSTLFNSKENNNFWNPNKTEIERHLDRKSLEYSTFVNKVLARDNYTCQRCGYKGDLKVHHLNGYNWYIEGRYNVINGITLCGSCHNKFHSQYGKGDNTKNQFDEWIGSQTNNTTYDDDYHIARRIINLDTDEIDTASVFSRKYKIQDTVIYQCCNKIARQAKGYHFLWHDDYLQMNKSELDNFWEWSKTNKRLKKIICTTTGDIFYSLPEIEKKYPLCSGKAVWYCLNNNGNYSGKLSDGTKLKWMYYEDYLKSTASLEVSI